MHRAFSRRWDRSEEGTSGVEQFRFSTGSLDGRLEGIGSQESSNRMYWSSGGIFVLTFLLWVLLFIISWPLALFVLILYPVLWLLLLPFRILGIAVEGVLELIWAMVTLPARLLRRI